jgi:hypothetical protein
MPGERPPEGEDLVEVTGTVAREFETAGHMEELLAGPEAELRRRDPVGIIVNSGSRDSWAWPHNEAGAAPRQSGLRYTTPALRACHSLDLPRIVLLNDPKCLPSEGEMVTAWPRVRPAAVLANEDRSWAQEVQGRALRCRSVRASTYWPCSLPVAAPPASGEPLVIAAAQLYHPTMSGLTGRARRERWWAETIDAALDEWPGLVGACGGGWEDYPRVGEMDWPGQLATMEEVLAYVARGSAGFCLPQQSWHESPKPLWYAMVGSQPLVHASYPGDHLPACCRYGDGVGVAAALERAEAEGAAELVLAACRPDFSALHSLVDDLLAGRPVDTGRYGGYALA